MRRAEDHIYSILLLPEAITRFAYRPLHVSMETPK